MRESSSASASADDSSESSNSSSSSSSGTSVTVEGTDRAGKRSGKKTRIKVSVKIIDSYTKHWITMKVLEESREKQINKHHAECPKLMYKWWRRKHVHEIKTNGAWMWFVLTVIWWRMLNKWLNSCQTQIICCAGIYHSAKIPTLAHESFHRTQTHSTKSTHALPITPVCHLNFFFPLLLVSILCFLSSNLHRSIKHINWFEFHVFNYYWIGKFRAVSIKSNGNECFQCKILRNILLTSLNKNGCHTNYPQTE